MRLRDMCRGMVSILRIRDSRMRALAWSALCLMTLGLTPSSLLAEVRFVPGELVVKMQPGQTIDQVNIEFGTLVRQRLPFLNVYLVSIEDENLETLAAEISLMAGVSFCHPNYVIDPLQPVQSSLPVSDARPDGSFTSQSSNTQLRLDSTHYYSTGNNVRVAVLDGGANFAHQELANVATSGYDYVDDDLDAFDEAGGLNSGHGTFVAGVITLVAPNAEVRAYRVTNLVGESDGYLVAEAVMQAVADGCRVINLSMVAVEPHQAITEAVAFAAANDVVVIAAAGNGQSSNPHFPASDANVLGVAAVDTTNLLADFSSFGAHVDICAPGTSIYGPYLDSGYVVWGGTSFAAPFVAAQVALLISYDPGATRQELLDAILSTANNIDDINPAFSGQLGAGMIDPLASVLQVRGAATVLRVPDNFPTIQGAIDVALDGDTVLVASGEYVENLDFGLRAISVISEQGAKLTTIRPLDTEEPTVLMGQSFSPQALKGFTLTGGTGDEVVLIEFFGATVSENIFTGNMLLRRRNVIEVTAYGATTTISRNVFYGNNRGTPIQTHYDVRVDGHTYITNNTFFATRYDPTIELARTGVNNPVEVLPISITNNIFSDSIYMPVSSEDLTPESFEYNLIHIDWVRDEFGQWVDSSLQLFADPEFLCTECGDFQILPNSPAVDAGHPDPLYNDPDGSRNDIGAFPASGLDLPRVYALSLIDRNVSPPSFTWKPVDTGGMVQEQYQMQVGTDNDWTVAELWDSGPVSSASDTVVYAGPAIPFAATTHLRLRLHNGIQWSEWSELSFLLVGGHLIHVPSEASSLQFALDIALIGDTVLVAPGLYSDPILIEPSGIVVRSSAGAATTILETEVYGDPMVTFGEGGSILVPTLLDGFTIQNSAIGVLLSNSDGVQIRDCRIVGNASKGIDAIYSDSLVIANCEFDSNFNPAYVKYGNCRFDSNLVVNSRGFGEVHCISFDFAAVIARYNILARNDCSFGFYFVQGKLMAHDNTVYGTTKTGIYSHPGTHDGMLFNNLVVNNGGEGIRLASEPVNIEVDYNNSFGNVGADRVGFSSVPLHSLSLDPLFIDSAATTFELSEFSPCIDVGHPNSLYDDPDGTQSDIGAVQGPSPAGPYVRDVFVSPVDSNGAVVSMTPTISWQHLNTSGFAQEQYQIQVSTDADWSVAEAWDSGPVISTDSSAAYAGAPLIDFNDSYARVRVHDGVMWSQWRVSIFNLKVGSVIDVPSVVTTIQEAVDRSYEGDTILVGPGTYVENVVVSSKALTFLSSGGPEVTILSGSDSKVGPLINLTDHYDTLTVIRGFTFQESRSLGLRSYARVLVENCRFLNCESSAISLYEIFASAEINNCIISGNKRGVYAICDTLIMRNCEIVDNSHMLSAGGMYINSNHSDISYSLVANNTVTGNGHGGGIYYYHPSSVKLTNNTFYGNSATSDLFHGGAVYLQGGTNPVVDARNNIFAENGPGNGLYTSRADSVTLEYNCAFGNLAENYVGVIPGLGSIEVDPMFVDPLNGDFRLQPGSPCINAGDPSLEFFELDGSFADMGAFGTGDEAVYPLPSEVHIEGENPLRVITATPTFRWTYEDTTGSSQQSYELQVSSAQSNWVDSLIWTSGTTSSVDPFALYAGIPLSAGINYFARVRVHNGSVWGGWRFMAFHTNGAPSVPLLLHPKSFVPQRLMYLRVNPSTDGEGDSVFYDYQLATDGTFSDILFSIEGTSEVRIDLDTVYDWGSTGAWRARATDGLEATDWVTENFSLADTLGRLSIVSPDGSDIHCGTPVDIIVELSLPSPGYLREIISNLAVYSPELASFDTVNANWSYSDVAWDEVYDLIRQSSTSRSGDSDIVELYGTALGSDGYRYTTGPVEIYKLTTTIDCEGVGQQICLEEWFYGTTYSSWMIEYTPDGESRGLFAPSWDGPLCFTISECCDGLRGDATGTGGNIDISDVVYLISYIFKGGPEPGCFEEANFNGDIEEKITISDVTSMIAYIFSAGSTQIYACDEYASAMSLRRTPNSEPKLYARYVNDTTVIWLSTPVDLQGIDMTLAGRRTGNPVSLMPEGIEALYPDSSESQHYGLLDMEGLHTLPAGEYALMSIPGGLDPLEAVAADENHNSVNVRIIDSPVALPKSFALHQNYPNPFNPSTQIAFDLPRPAQVTLEVFNILGQRVITLIDDNLDAGSHHLKWEGLNQTGSSVASGVYLYRIKADSFTASKTMLLVK